MNIIKRREMIVKEYIERLQYLIEKYPEILELPVVQCVNDNDCFTVVDFGATLARVINLDTEEPVLEGYFDDYEDPDEESIQLESVNCLIIN